MNQDDEFNWSASPDGRFTTKSAYLSYLKTTSNGSNSIFKIIWKWKGNERIRYLLWKLGNENILTNVERQRRMLSPTSFCPICGVDDETLLHRFRDCQSSLAIWNGFTVRNQNNFYGTGSWNLWFKENLEELKGRDEEPDWTIVFGVTLDTIWRNRNECIFEQKSSPANVCIIKIRNHVEGIKGCKVKNQALWPQILPSSVPTQMAWSPPPMGVWKLNCDGSV